MLRVDGSEFRTLRHPMYVNGRHVREVWANGIQVYPEGSGGQGPGGGGGSGTIPGGHLAKIRGHLSEVCQFYYPQWGGQSYIDWVSNDPFYSIFKIDASFVATLKVFSRYGKMTEKDRLEIPISRINTGINGEWTSNRTHLQIYRNTESEQEQYGRTEYDGLGYFQPLVPPYPQQTATRQAITLGLPFGYGDTWSTRYMTGDILFKWEIQPPQIPGLFRQRWWSYGSGDTGYQYVARPQSQWLNGACAWNGKLLSNSGQAPTISSPMGDGTLSANLKSLYTLDSNQYKDYYNSVSFLSISVTDIMAYYTVFNVYYYLIPKPDATAPVKFSGYEFANIPITDILYLGEEDDAPEWAKHVYESDLI